MSEILIDALKDAAIDTLKLIPFLLVTYWLMELFEHKMSEKTKDKIERAGHAGPLIGGLLGAVPQCGFSAAAASLYSGRVITVGTLLAIFLSTSDEMLPIFISERVGVGLIVKVLITKIVIGIVFGFAVDLVVTRYNRRHSIAHDYKKETHEHHHCEEEDGVVVSTLKHTLETTIYIFLISFVITLIVEGVGTDRLSSLITDIPVIGEMIAGLIGLIPNCAASIAITEMYLSGVITFADMISGLLVGAGVGVLVLVRSNKNPKENLLIICTLYILGVLGGCLVGIFM